MRATLLASLLLISSLLVGGRGGPKGRTDGRPIPAAARGLIAALDRLSDPAAPAAGAEP